MACKLTNKLYKLSIFVACAPGRETETEKSVQAVDWCLLARLGIYIYIHLRLHFCNFAVL